MGNLISQRDEILIARKNARWRYLQWLSVALLMAVGIVFVLDRSTLSIANHAASSELHLSAVQMVLLLSAPSLPTRFGECDV